MLELVPVTILLSPGTLSPSVFVKKPVICVEYKDKTRAGMTVNQFPVRWKFYNLYTFKDGIDDKKSVTIVFKKEGSSIYIISTALLDEAAECYFKSLFEKGESAEVIVGKRIGMNWKVLHTFDEKCVRIRNGFPSVKEFLN
jgi:hypothetical protein